MAGIATIIGAFAFTGSNFLFASFKPDNAKEIEAERKRHDLALEEFTRVRNEWERERTKYLDLINVRLRDEAAAKQTFHDVDNAMYEYYVVTGKRIEMPENLKTENEPNLTDFYEPSESQKDRELVWIVLGTAAIGVVSYNLF